MSVGLRPVRSEDSREPVASFDRIDELQWYPDKPIAPEFPDVPDDIARAAREAHAVASIGADSAAILMARTVVEASAKFKEITNGTLYAKIDALAEADLIRSSTRDAAHEIRHLGNNMAHGDLDDTPQKDDVTDVLALMDEVLRELFQGPATTARIRARRQALK